MALQAGCGCCHHILYGVFEKLKDPAFFNRIQVTDGFVSWPDELDLAPDAMYDEIKLHGEWILS